MGFITCSRCGKKIHVRGSIKKYAAPIAVSPHKGAPRFLKFLCERCKSYVIEEAYGRLREKALKEKIKELKKK